eukprot:12421423-Alexandrium_andersonii.AAC.1
MGNSKRPEHREMSGADCQPSASAKGTPSRPVWKPSGIRGPWATQRDLEHRGMSGSPSVGTPSRP